MVASSCVKSLGHEVCLLLLYFVQEKYRPFHFLTLQMPSISKAIHFLGGSLAIGDGSNDILFLHKPEPPCRPLVQVELCELAPGEGKTRANAMAFFGKSRLPHQRANKNIKKEA